MDRVDADGTRPGHGTTPEPSTNLARRDRLRLVLERDGTTCVWCRRAIDTDLVPATTEHVVPRIKGGPSWLENEVAACARCNRERGHRTPADWIEECERRGWEPATASVVAALRSLQVAIAERGGQRRARPYVTAQLRRLDRT
jgi:CRISPR/Cas system Type II protein with McrA/HNH and RuvC-like nuclease domain